MVKTAARVTISHLLNQSMATPSGMLAWFIT